MEIKYAIEDAVLLAMQRLLQHALFVGSMPKQSMSQQELDAWEDMAKKELLFCHAEKVRECLERIDGFLQMLPQDERDSLKTRLIHALSLRPDIVDINNEIYE